jgi:hypothetical protein
LGNAQTAWTPLGCHAQTRSTMGRLTTFKCPHTHIFSESEILKSFVLMLNSIDIGNRFSDIDIPLVSKAQGKILAAYFFAFHRALQSTIQNTEQRIESNKGKPEKQADVQKDTKNLQAHYSSLYTFNQVVNSLSPSESIELKRLSHIFNSKALNKLATQSNSVQKRFKRIPNLLKPSGLYNFPPLLTTGPIVPDIRFVGDCSNHTCYICGRELKRGQGVKGNKIILASPSQTPQSGTSQKTTQPVCGVCANLAFISPIKLGGDTFVVRLRENLGKSEYRYLLEDHLRMFVLGELNVYAGRYVMLTCTEKIGKDSLMKELYFRQN